MFLIYVSRLEGLQTRIFRESIKTRASRTTGAKGIKFVQVVASYSKHQIAFIRNLVFYRKYQIAKKMLKYQINSKYQIQSVSDSEFKTTIMLSDIG